MPNHPVDSSTTSGSPSDPGDSAERELRARARQQEVVALLGRKALADEPVASLHALAVALVRDTLRVDFVTVLELQADGETLLIRTGIGWEEEVVGKVAVTLDSQSGYTLRERRPVVVEDLGAESRFPTPALAVENRITSGVSVVIESGPAAYGVLIAHSRERRAFTPNDVQFLQSVADVLALALEHERAETKLRFQAQLLDAVGEAVMATGPDGRIVYWNRKAEDLYGWTAAEAIGRDIVALIPSSQSREQAVAIMERLRRGESWSGEFEVRHRDGSHFPAQVTDTALHDAEGRVIGVVGVSHDLTEQKALEQQFRQAQRMEAVGRLAGGIAHDFNNILTVIFGYSQSLASSLPEGSPARDAADEVLRAAKRAANLTRQLLAFSRKQILQPRVLDLGEVVRGLEKMLRRLLGEDVNLAVEVAPDLGPVHADPGQIEQVLMNLAINSRDAMPSGGRLVIALRNVTLDQGTDAEGDEIPAGAYVLLSVRDSGTGIAPDVIEHVFEPFFTTKDMAKGTGLGLSTVYGIVRQSGGYVRVASELGSGTTIEVLLPHTEGTPDREVVLDRLGPELPRGRNETVLIVEDEDAVRCITHAVLQNLGYRVLQTVDPLDALERILPEHGAEIDLLLTDVVMPGIGGGELVARVQELYPRMRTIFMSGYAEGEVNRRGIRAADRFLQKPFTLETLARKVREVLDAHPPRPGTGGRPPISESQPPAG